MTIAEANKGETVRVMAMPPGIARTQILRLGIVEGSQVTCMLNIPADPVVECQGNLKVALGRRIASRMEVERCA